MNIKRKLNQTAVYWPKGARRNDGKEGFGTAVQIDCRWEDTQVEIKDATKANGVWMGKSVIDTDHPVQQGGYLWKGLLADVVSALDPRANPDAGRIEYRDGIPSVDATQTLYTAYL